MSSRLRATVCGLLLLAGPVLGVWTVRLGVPLQSRDEKHLLGWWYRWSLPSPASAHHSTLLMLALSLLAAVWLGVACLLAGHPSLGRWTTRAAWLWALPFALGAPFQSRDVYAYVAQGAQLHERLDPYTVGPRSLGAHDVLLQAVDPRWRSNGSPYGPLALRIASAATSVGGHGVGAIVALRVLAVLSVLGIVLLLRREAPAGRADLLTWLTLSPLILVQLVSAVHWEAELALLLVAAVVLARRGHLAAAVLLALLATEVKASAAVVVVVLAVHAVRRRRLAALPLLLGSAALAVAVDVLALPRDPWGWIHNVAGSSGSWSPFAPASTLYLVVDDVLPRQSGLLLGCRVVASVAAVALCVALLRSRDADLAARAGLLTLAAVVALPTVWPWYVAPATLLTLLSLPRFWWWGSAVAVAGSLAALPVDHLSADRAMLAAEVVAVLACLGRSRISRTRALLPLRD